MKQYDYIFTGTGLATLMTVYRMILSEKFQEKTILLIDQETKQTNNRTWCFWSEKETIWEGIISKRWQKGLVADANEQLTLNLHPYQYNKIQGLDFYNQSLELVLKQKNIHFSHEKVVEIEETEQNVFVKTENNQFCCTKLFNSIYNQNWVENQTKYPCLQQHFLGWFIKTEQAAFNPKQATLMDFSVNQSGNTRFMYVLPTSETEALVEYTLFSDKLLTKEAYETAIKEYLQELKIGRYQILEKEQGSIPMTVYPFWKHNTKNVINIGTAGGWTKPSTGYTFRNSDKKSAQLVSFLQTETDFRRFHKATKFWFYDLLLLDILSQKNQLGSTIFFTLFKKGDAKLIFKFLDEETSFYEDLQVIWKCPKGVFITALLKRVFGLSKREV